jgi:hypothetical protein
VECPDIPAGNIAYHPHWHRGCSHQVLDITGRRFEDVNSHNQSEEMGWWPMYCLNILGSFKHDHEITYLANLNG